MNAPTPRHSLAPATPAPSPSVTRIVRNHDLRQADRPHGARPQTGGRRRGVLRRAGLLLMVALLFALSLTAGAQPARAAADGATPTININTADADTLALLPRVGPALAGRIVAFREDNGPFEQPEDLILVRGIGERTFEVLAPYVRIQGETTLREKVRAGAWPRGERDDG